MKLNAQDIEVLVANHFGYRQNIIVPNVSWGLGFRHECDLLVVRPQTGFADEVEIKISASDIRADAQKGHEHISTKIRRLWFAVPQELCRHARIPVRAGVLSIWRYEEWGRYQWRVAVMRKPVIQKQARPLTPKEIEHLLHLGCMRIWDLKQALARRRHEKQGENGV
jgi:hypothetical protein